jgi:hypothetical protein
MAPQKPVKTKHVLATPDFWGNPVHCTADNWTGHIIDPLDGHPELAGREQDVAKAIQDPEIIRPSTKTGKAFAFERVTTADTIRAIVYYDDQLNIKTGGTFGWVGTAYPVDTAYSSQVGAPIYQKPAPKPTTQHPTKKEGDA